ncbi:MAG: ROK family protein [Deltaproteobacteria bacterium]|nr:ROK family protein [Deltaproteobacteria bacterium]
MRKQMTPPAESPISIGVDLGGTKIEIIALDADANERYRRRIPTPANSYNKIIESIVDLVTEVESKLNLSARVGVCTPGSISPSSGRIKNSNTICLIGEPIAEDLSRALSRSVRCANDADCFALSEASDGAAAAERVVFGVILGTGTGGGIVIDKKLIVGPNAISGEWGHNPLPWSTDAELAGHWCYCGKLGCIETFLSGPGLSRDFEGATGEKIAAFEIAARAAAGDEAAEAALTRYEDRLARGLASVINVLDPDAVVLGGGLSNMERLYTAVPQLLTRYVFSDRVSTKVVRALHGDSSGVRGAARLWSTPND